MIESVKPDPSLMPIPRDCGLISDRTRPRLTSEQAAMAVNCLVRDDGPRQLRIFSTSGVKGEPGNEWVEVSSQWETGFYHFCFYYRGGMITNLFLMTTPKGAEYNISIDGGSPFDGVSIEDAASLTRMVVGREDDPIKVVPCWIVTVRDARPYTAHLFYSPEEAEQAAAEQRQHYEKYNRAPQLTEDNAKRGKREEKKKVMEANSIAFKAKKKGTKK